MAFEKVIASRERSIRMLETRIAEYERIRDGQDTAAGRAAVASLIDVDIARKNRLVAELDVFKKMSVDSRQTEIPGSRPGKGK